MLITTITTLYLSSFVVYSKTNIWMIYDIISCFDKPFIITGLLCDNKEIFPFIKSFSKGGYISYVQDINRINKDNYTIINADNAVYVLDLSCEESANILTMANQQNLFSVPNRWIIINTSKSTSIHSRHLSMLPDSDVMLITLESGTKSVIQKIYRPVLNFPLIYENYGTWKMDIGYKVTANETITVNRRKNLFGMTLKACLVITHNDSFNHLLDKRNRHIDSIAKVNYVFMLHLKDFLNATMAFSVQSTWGYKNNKSEWSGMIGELIRKEADIGGTPLFLTRDRVSVIDYIAMTTPTKSKFVFRQPKLSYITNVFTLPFETTVWISAGALVVIISLGLYFVAVWESYKVNKLEVQKEEQIEPKFISALFIAFSAVCQQGASSIPYTVSGRIITIISFTSLMFLYASYSANIVALLQSSSTSIQTLKDLLNSRVQIGVDDTVFNRFYFPNASDPIRKAIYLQKVVPPGQPPRYFSIEDGVKKMRHGLFAFHMETGAGYKLVGETFLEGEKCDLQEIQFLQVPDPWLAIQKNSSYKEMLKIGLRKIHESGIQPREVALLYTKKPTCTSRGSSFVGVSIIDCYPAAQMLIVGYLLAFCIFITEVLYYYRTKIYLYITLRNYNPPYTE